MSPLTAPPPADGEEETGKQDEEGPAQRRVPGAAGEAAALLQDRQGLQGGETPPKPPHGMDTPARRQPLAQTRVALSHAPELAPPPVMTVIVTLNPR